MRFWKVILPNLTISLNLVLMIVIYLDRRNPMMGFLSGAPFAVLAACACICAIATAGVLYADQLKGKIPERDKTIKKYRFTP